MATITVDVPEDLKGDFEEAAKACGQDFSTKLHSAMRRELWHDERLKVESVLLERINSPSEPWNPQDLEDIRKNLLAQQPR